jgi:hypothetical protein
MSCLRNALDSLDGLPAPVLFDKLELALSSIRLDTPSVLAYGRHIHRRSSLPVDLSQGSLLDVESVLGVQTLVTLDLVSQLFGTRVDDARLEGDKQGVGFGERVRAGVVQVQEELRDIERGSKAMSRCLGTVVRHLPNHRVLRALASCNTIPQPFPAFRTTPEPDFVRKKGPSSLHQHPQYCYGAFHYPFSKLA